MAEGQAAPWTRLAAALFALGVLALGASGLVFYATLPARLPSPLDWRSAAVLLARDARPGDVVALDPSWAERGREVLPASVPVLAFPRLAGEDLLGVRRVGLVALPRAPGRHATLERDLVARAGRAFGPLRLGGLEIARYDLRSPLLPLAFLPDRLATASVSAGGEACARDDRGAFRCPAISSVVVAREEREVDFLPRPCLFAHPAPPGAEPLTVVFPDVPMGRALQGHTAIVGEAALTASAPVEVAVKVDGEVVGTAEEPPGQLGWHAFRFDTPRAAGRVATVTFTVAAADAARREFCFDAYTLP